MLFGYPVSATAENWLHECLREILCSIHTSLKAAATLPAWPEIIPARYRRRLEKRRGLEDRLNNYKTALEKLTTAEQNRILQAFHDQNQIDLLLSCQLNCEAIGDLPEAIHEPVKKLFEFGFELLTKLEIRDKHYKAIYDAAPSHTCPFCGCENFDAPEAPREALDHYLAESKYPFAASNLRNLVPMGNKCNSRYKLAEDILSQKNGTRRKSFDPYNCTGIRFSLNKSQPFAGKTGQLPRWQIEFEPNTEEVITWDEVFHIQERYERDVLNPKFKSWLDDFKHWCKSAKITPSSDQELLDGINSYATLYEEMGISDRAFLKAAVFRMLHTHCQQGDQRLISLIMNIVNPGQTNLRQAP
ncbi:hypothetical protein ANSO36C_45790 [Nostoc cf. commune SO-36]|uniref:Transposase n=1 Tax=Nostoc cf. commune SO-36 TaxID=449208 RepID=A0ABM7Z6R4_NOSCO|nr:hypothetical protein [Nostoc commune]BDI18777.1 hypothetical protein ANSO36C_45790 [Nostoc cf. commune SO-36]